MDLLFLFVIIFFICFLIFIIRVPIIIAKSRGICDNELNTITILSWVGIFIFFTWFIALILALIWKPDKWIDKNNTSQPNHLNDWEALEKLFRLKEQGIISQTEFETEKMKIMSKNNL